MKEAFIKSYIVHAGSIQYLGDEVLFDPAAYSLKTISESISKTAIG